MKAIKRIKLNYDDIGYVESFDFSRANMNQEARVLAITTIASVCYQNPKAIGSIKLYDRLAIENKGLPSSSYEFVPILLSFDGDEETDITKVFNIACGENICNYEDLSSIKYGEKVEDDKYLLTNLRALIVDVGDKADQFFNTSEEEIQIIKDNFKVFKSKIDLSTRAQFIRHRVSWQELSRRYVSGKKSEFEFYLSPRLENSELIEEYNDMVLQSVSLYNRAISNNIKPEEARRILPQAMYTTVWSAWQPKQLEVFYKLRLDKHAQQEIRWLAEGMKELTDV